MMQDFLQPLHMKIILSLLCRVFLFNGALKAQQTNIDSSITSMSLFMHVKFLASDALKGRSTGTPEAVVAANYIADEFKKAGLLTLKGNEGYFQNFAIDFGVATMPAINVIGALPGNIKSDSIIIISAHYDHVGMSQSASDSDMIYNGANDNASGVAAMIEIAKYYSSLKENKYTLFFIAFAAEELGLMGSKYESSITDNRYIKSVINIDMIGKPMPHKPNKCMVITTALPKMIRRLNREITSQDFFIRDQYPKERLELRTDAASFPGCKEAFSFTTFYTGDELYHKPGDELNTIDFTYMTFAVKNIAQACRIFIK